MQGNIAKIQEMTKRWERFAHGPPVSDSSPRLSSRSIPPKSLDLLVLPEMAVTGYMYSSASAIEPYLEPPRIGPTSLLCRDLAKRLKCHIITGYPERIPDDEIDTQSDERKGWNSAAVVDPTGQVVGNYRKSFLYYTDQSWAREGEWSGSPEETNAYLEDGRRRLQDL